MQLHVQLDGVTRVMTLSEFEEMVRQGQIGPEVLVRWERVTGSEFWPASRLELYRGVLDAPDMRLRRAWQARNVPWMTALIVGLCVRIQLWLYGTQIGESVWKLGLRWLPAAVEERQVWRLYTFGFLHGGLSHIVMNMLFVAYAGVALENMFGAANLLLLFIVGVFGGGLFSSAFDPDMHSVGASSGDFALMGACVIFGWRHSEIIPARARPAFGGAILIFTLQALLNTFGEKGVDYLAHLGGLLLGGLLTAFLRPVALEGAAAWNRKVQGISWTLILGTTLVMGVMGPRLLPLSIQEEDGLQVKRPTWWTPGWSALGSSAWMSVSGETALVIATEKMDEATSLEAEKERLELQWRRIDPQATFETEAEKKGEVDGYHVKMTVTVEGILHEGEGWLGVRGHYVHTVLIEGTEPELREVILPKVLDSVRMVDPDDVQKERQGNTEESWRSLLHLAQADILVGRQEEALARLAEAHKKAPEEPSVVMAMMEALVDPPRADGVAVVEQILQEFPEDRKVYAQVVKTLKRLGAEERANAVLIAGREKWPKDRRLERIQREWAESPASPP